MEPEESKKNENIQKENQEENENNQESLNPNAKLPKTSKIIEPIEEAKITKELNDLSFTYVL